MPDDKTIEEFQRIYFAEFGEKISKEEASERFLRVINVARAFLGQDAD